jgi:hypothetical protein
MRHILHLISWLCSWRTIAWKGFQILDVYLEKQSDSEKIVPKIYALGSYHVPFVLWLSSYLDHINIPL